VSRVSLAKVLFMRSMNLGEGGGKKKSLRNSHQGPEKKKVDEAGAVPTTLGPPPLSRGTRASIIVLWAACVGVRQEAGSGKALRHVGKEPPTGETGKRNVEN